MNFLLTGPGVEGGGGVWVKVTPDMWISKSRLN